MHLVRETKETEEVEESEQEGEDCAQESLSQAGQNWKMNAVRTPIRGPSASNDLRHQKINTYFSDKKQLSD